jgi:hypothetical protein
MLLLLLTQVRIAMQPSGQLPFDFIEVRLDLLTVTIQTQQLVVPSSGAIRGETAAQDGTQRLRKALSRNEDELDTGGVWRG